MNFISALPGALAQGLIWGVMALGVYISYKILDFADMSTDGTFPLGAAVSIMLTLKAGWNPFVTLLFSVVAGMLAGALTGLLTTKVKIPGLLSGILMMLALYSINLLIMGRSNTPLAGVPSAIEIVQNWLKSITGNLIPQNVLGIALGFVFCLALVLVMYFFFGTEVGCALRATGCNQHTARAQGVSTDRMLILGLMLSNGLVALAGGLWSQFNTWADVGMGTGTMVTGLASIIIGDTVFRFMQRSFILRFASAVLGSVTYWLVVTLVLQLGLGANNLKLFTAVIVIAALGVPRLFQHYRSLSETKDVRKADRATERAARKAEKEGLK